MKKCAIAVSICVLSIIVLSVSARARFVFAHAGYERSSYSSVSELLINGDAELFDRFLCLTPAKMSQRTSAWYAEKQDVGAGFGTIFQVQISEMANNFEDDVLHGLGGDGFAFVIQNESEDALGWSGGGLAYHGILNSVAIEFDLWDNNLSGHDYVGDPNGNHVSVHTGGFGPNNEREEFSLGSSTAIPKLADGLIHTIVIEYEPGTLYVYVDDLDNPALKIAIDLEQTIALDDGKAWVGFTASTGRAVENHDILNWAFTGKGWDGRGTRLAVSDGSYPAVAPVSDFSIAFADVD